MWLSIIPLTRHWLAIPKGPANFILNILITRKYFQWKDWTSRSSFEIELYRTQKKMLCATISIKSELTVLFTAWSRWWNILRRMMILDIWNSYIYDEVRDEIKRSSRQRTLLKRVVENRTRKKLNSVRDLNPWPLWYRCSALLIELTSQLGTGSK